MKARRANVRVWVGLLVVALAVSGLFLLMGRSSWAAGTASAVASVRVQVEPQISVTAVTPAVELGSAAVGEFPATVVFRVRANAVRVHLHVMAADLQGPLGEAGGQGESSAIPLSSRAVTVATSAAGESLGRGGGVEAPHLSAGSLPADRTSLQTEYVEFQPGDDRPDTRVTLSWKRDEAVLPVGRYQARVGLVALIMPE